LLSGGRPCWLLDQLGEGCALLLFLDDPDDLGPALVHQLEGLAAEVATKVIVARPGAVAPRLHGLPAFGDADGLAAARYGAAPGTCVLVRPDQHVSARWRAFDVERVRAAWRRTLGEAARAPSLAEA
jgi:3-(3-hydroxy-phenyl)propionate hydroxylase